MRKASEGNATSSVSAGPTVLASVKESLSPEALAVTPDADSGSSTNETLITQTATLAGVVGNF